MTELDVIVPSSALSCGKPQSLDWTELRAESSDGGLPRWRAPKVDVFLPAICIPPILEGVQRYTRAPEWYALRCVVGKEKLLLWFLDQIRMPWRHLTYFQRVKRSRPVKRSWLPGYLFLEFDKSVDRWQQIVRMPYAQEFLGSPSPIPTARFEDLVKRCPEHLNKTSAVASVANGTLIRVLKGPLAGHKAVVGWSDRKSVRCPMLMFGRSEVEVTLNVRDIEIVAD